MAKKKARRGRPPTHDQPMGSSKMVRLPREDELAFEEECARLTKITGTKWSVSAYLRLAGRAFLGKHLTP